MIITGDTITLPKMVITGRKIDNIFFDIHSVDTRLTYDSTTGKFVVEELNGTLQEIRIAFRYVLAPIQTELRHIVSIEIAEVAQISGAIVVQIRFNWSNGDITYNSFPYDDLTDSIWYYMTSLPGNHWAVLDLAHVRDPELYQGDRSANDYWTNLWDRSGTRILPPSFRYIKNGYPKPPGYEQPNLMGTP
jgi:hypothetical protein